MNPLNRRPLTVAGLTLLSLALTLGTPRSAAQATPNVPERMTYQGFLTDGNGVALGNDAPKNYDVIFRIYNHENQAAPANLLWSEQQTVTVDKGYFSVLLQEGAQVGSEPRPQLSTLFRGPTASERWVGITVKGIGTGGANVDILPRLRMMSAPYTFLAQQANKVVQGDGTDLISASGNSVTIAGPVTATSFSGNGANLTALNASQLTAGNLPDARLSVNIARRDAPNIFTGDQGTTGHLRVGKLENGPVGDVGYGKAVVFSGAPDLSVAFDNDNSDPLWIARYNAGANQTQLRVSLGDDPGSPADRFVIGTTVGADFNQIYSWTPLFSVDAQGTLELRPDVSKDINNGKIGYQVFSDGLDIVGAGTSWENRKISLHAQGGLFIHGPVANGLNVHSGWGRTFEVPNDYVQVLHYADKSKAFAMYRADTALVLWLRGANYAGSADRRMSFDGDNNWDYGSDRRLKKDIVDAEPMLDRALKVQLRRYRWKDDAPTAKHMLGVVAQELQPLFPDMVGELEAPGGGEKHLTVGYSDFGMIAVKALQEFKAQHDAEVAGLRSELAQLKAQMAELLRVAQEQRQATAEGSAVTAATGRQ